MCKQADKCPKRAENVAIFQNYLHCFLVNLSLSLRGQALSCSQGSQRMLVGLSGPNLSTSDTGVNFRRL